MAGSNKKDLLRNIDKFIRSKNLESALKLCNDPICENDVTMQQKKMEILCMLKRYPESIAIGERPEFINDVPIQLKLVQAYMGIKDYEKAKAICLKEEFASLPGFIQLEKRIKKDLFRINGPETNITSDDFDDYVKKIDDLVNMAKQDKNPGRARTLLRKALGFCSHETFKDDINAIYYKIKILKLLSEYEIALEIVSSEKYTDNKEMFIQRISILSHLKRYDEALKLIDKSTFKNDNTVINLRQSILAKKEKPIKKQPDDRQKTFNYTDVLKFIEDKKLPLAVIKTLDINQMVKDLFVIAYYEIGAYPIDSIRDYISEIVFNYSNIDDYLEIIDYLDDHFDQNKPKYDRSLYERLLIKADSINISASRK